MFWYHVFALLAIVLSVPLYGYVLVLFFCALLAIVLSIPLYGYALVSFFVLY
jgi:tetrahydromethanopterin S-methyltransferase subunit B